MKIVANFQRLKIKKNVLIFMLFFITVFILIFIDYKSRFNKQSDYKNSDSAYEYNYEKNVEHLANLSAVNESEVDKEKIIAEYLAKFEKNQPEAAIYIQEGFRLKKERKFEEAEAKFKMAIELNPLEYQSYLGLTEIYRFYMKDKEESIPRLLMAPLQYEPKNIIFLRALAQYYESKNNYQEARKWYGKILEFYPGDAPAKQKFDEMEGYLQVYRRSY